MASYLHDVYLSYRSTGHWPMFVEKSFAPKFRHWLGTDLGREPLIFDPANSIESAGDWADSLATALASSRVMVCLWSRSYFTSSWCSAELGIMMRRKKLLSQVEPTPRLIVPVVIHDSEDLPSELDQIQRFNLSQYANPWIAAGSEMDELLSEKIRQISSVVAHAVEDAPPYDPTWEDLTKASFGRMDNQISFRPPDNDDARNIGLPRLG